jgi:hypothetical protein
MDLIASLQLEDLPEQQTRTLHLVEANPDFQLKLGFDACAACGISLTTDATITCRTCQRISYCSDTCLAKDADILGMPEDETALGHSSIICALLNLCNDDEAIDQGEGDGFKASARDAAVNRVRSEYESYPATLVNVLLDGPCYQDILRRSSESVLRIHVIGAAEDAELSQGPTMLYSDDATARRVVCQDYAEALAEVADRFHRAAIELWFIGPEAPDRPWNESVPMNHMDQVVGTLTIRSLKALYTTDSLEKEEGTAATSPDLVVLFNPGFTCPDYTHWAETLRGLPDGTPFLSTTNTEMECIADCQYLLDQDKIQSLPPGMAELLDVYSEDADESSSFLGLNPFCGSRVRQNGTLANDVFVKNRWMLGGILGRFQASSRRGAPSGPVKRTKVAENNNDPNSKASNPALI